MKTARLAAGFVNPDFESTTGGGGLLFSQPWLSYSVAHGLRVGPERFWLNSWAFPFLSVTRTWWSVAVEPSAWATQAETPRAGRRAELTTSGNKESDHLRCFLLRHPGWFVGDWRASSAQPLFSPARAPASRDHHLPASSLSVRYTQPSPASDPIRHSTQLTQRKPPPGQHQSLPS
jgi:hypothetical protein